MAEKTSFKYPLQYYDKILEYQTEFLKQHVQKMGFEGQEHVLEIGCRRGALSFCLGSQVSTLTAIDYDENNIRSCWKKKDYLDSDNIFFQIENWENISLDELEAEYEYVIASHLHDFSDIAKICKASKKGCFLLVPTDRTLHDVVYETLYEGLLNEKVALNDCIHVEEDYAQTFMKLYQYGIDPDIIILEDGIRGVFADLNSMYEEMSRLLPVQNEKKAEFMERLKAHSVEWDDSRVLLIKTKTALIRWKKEE